MYKKILLAVTTLLLIQGCASNYKSDTNHSLAWNISKASDVKVDEIPQNKFEEAIRRAFDGDLNNGEMNKLLDAGLTSGFVDSSTGLLALADVRIAFDLSLLLRLGEPDNPATKDHILAWMPSSAAKDEEEAVHVMIRTLVETLKKLPEPYASSIDWEKTEREMKEVEQPFLKSYYRLIVYFTGGVCDVVDCRLYMHLFEPELVSKPDFIHNKEEAFYHFKPDGHDVPNIFVGCGFPSAFFPSAKPIITGPWVDITNCSKKMMMVQEAYFSLLPDWFYVYKSPQEYGNTLPNLQRKDDLMLYIKPTSK